jgi:hypothetical protein
MTFEYAEQFKANQLELQRLNEENQTLVDARKRMDDTYAEEVRSLYERLSASNREVRKLTEARDKARSVRSKKAIDELTAWSTRSATMKRTIEKLEAQIKNMPG